MLALAGNIEKTMWDEKRLLPNLDFHNACAYHFMGIPREIFTPLFVLSRITGCSSHLYKQRNNNKLIHPVGSFIAPKPRGW
jgi:2-methylcitrate synthase